MKNQTEKRIFIIDDDPYWIAMLSQMLNEIGYRNIVEFENGTDCLSNLHLNPHMVFLDYQMEDMDGLEVLKRIKAMQAKLSVDFIGATGQ